MIKLTKEQYEKLTPFRDQLKTAYKSSFIRITTTEFQKVADIYAEVFGTPLRKGQMGCNTCRLNTMRKLGELYYSYVPEEKEEETEAKAPTKKGRPKKLVKEEE